MVGEFPEFVLGDRELPPVVYGGCEMGSEGWRVVMAVDRVRWYVMGLGGRWVAVKSGVNMKMGMGVGGEQAEVCRGGGWGV